MMPRTLTLDALPSPVSIDLSTTAVLVIDMQNDFGSPGGMFDRAGIPIDGIRNAVGSTANVLQAARAAGILVIYVKMGFRADLSDMGPSDAPNRVRHESFGVGETVRNAEGKEWRILIRDGWGTEIVDALQPQPHDLQIWKHRFSAFFETELDQRLKERRIKHLIVTGCTTSICVDSTVRDAFFRDYHCVLLTDCMAEPIAHDAPRSNHEATLLCVNLVLGWTSTSQQFLEKLKSCSSTVELATNG